MRPPGSRENSKVALEIRKPAYDVPTEIGRPESSFANDVDGRLRGSPETSETARDVTIFRIHRRPLSLKLVKWAFFENRLSKSVQGSPSMPTVATVANIEPGTQRFACVSSTFY